MSSGDKKVAIVCDWLTGIGGAERVVLELHRLYPNAPIYTSQYDPKSIDWFTDADVRTTWLQKLPVSLKKFLPLLRAWTFSRLDLSDYDVVITSSGAEAKAVKTGANTLHVNYCHAPTHYYWSRYNSYLENPNFPRGFNWLAKICLWLLVAPLRRWDKKAALRADIVVANSSHTQSEIAKYYGRKSTVVHPPVDIERFNIGKAKRNGFVITGRQIAYKRIDLAISACNELRVPLTVIGDGPEHSKLVQMAGPTIKFLTGVSDQEMPRYFQGAEAFIFPGLDDFGITPVEAMATGTPVIAYRAGGSLDYVVPNKTGVFFESQTTPSLVAALQEFSGQKFNEKGIRDAAKDFAPAVFVRKFRETISNGIA